MDYQPTLGLALMLLGLCLEALAILVTRNVLAGAIGLGVALIGWRVRWTE